MTVQELEELLNVLKETSTDRFNTVRRELPVWTDHVTDHVTAEQLRQTGPVAELHLRTWRQTLSSQSEQVLQAADQLLVMVLKLQAAPHLVAVATQPRLRTFQLRLDSQKCDFYCWQFIPQQKCEDG